MRTGRNARRSLRAVGLGASGLACCLLLVAADPAGAQETAVLRGTVTTSDGSPVGGARVLAGDSAIAITEANGSYRLTDLPAGRLTVRIEYLGFETVRTRLRLTAGESRTYSPSLRREAIEVADLLVEVPRRRRRWVRGMFRSVIRGHGDLISRREIEELQPSRTSDLLARLPNLYVRGLAERGTGNQLVVRCFGREQEPAVYLDGGLMPDLNVDDIPPDQIAALGVVRGPSVSALVPGCGAVLIVTRGMVG